MSTIGFGGFRLEPGMIRRAGGWIRAVPKTGVPWEGFERTHGEAWQSVIRTLPLQQGRFPFMGQEAGMLLPGWMAFAF
ncbi:hypothetical protein ABH19_04350 [Leptospirillum sp. Group II 'CF-1']|nr:hypothetical protein ABH19_04350 [Leptospirillum sp. Group II 'CF-1']